MSERLVGLSNLVRGPRWRHNRHQSYTITSSSSSSFVVLLLWLLLISASNARLRHLMCVRLNRSSVRLAGTFLLGAKSFPSLIVRAKPPTTAVYVLPSDRLAG